MALNTIPKTDIAVIIPNITQPSALSNKVKHTGMYVPNINKNMEQWSSIWKTFFPLLCAREWYIHENKYNSISVEPYNDALTTSCAVPTLAAFTISTTVPAIASPAPIPWDMALDISSPSDWSFTRIFPIF